MSFHWLEVSWSRLGSAGFGSKLQVGSRSAPLVSQPPWSCRIYMVCSFYDNEKYKREGLFQASAHVTSVYLIDPCQLHSEAQGRGSGKYSTHSEAMARLYMLVYNNRVVKHSDQWFGLPNILIWAPQYFRQAIKWHYYSALAFFVHISESSTRLRGQGWAFSSLNPQDLAKYLVHRTKTIQCEHMDAQ